MIRIVVLVCVCLVGCRDRSEPVVVYVSADEYVARQVLDAFEEATGTPVLMVGDTEATKTTGLVQRLRAEAGRPVADVFWSSEAIQTAALARDGLLAPHVSSVTRAWPVSWRDADHRWHGFSPRPRVLVYDPARLTPEEVPSTWQACADARWRGRLAFADPRFGTTGGHLAAMSVVFPDSWGAWVEALGSGRVVLTPGGNAGVVDLVRHGEVALGATDADDVRAANDAGASLAMVIPRHGDGVGQGAMLMPNTVAIVQGAPHPRQAAVLADWLLSDEVAEMLAASVSGNMPIQDAVAARYPDLVVDDPLIVPWDAVSDAAPSAIVEIVEAWSP